MTILLIVHGGAAPVTTNLIKPTLSDLRKSAKAGFLVLMQENNGEKGKKHLDAVEKAVQYMENSPYFNAGYGSSLTSKGNVEMDSIIADGKSLNFGAVSAVTSFKNPVSVARSILENSEHCFYTGEGAHQFGLQQGFHLIHPDSLIHQFAKVIINDLKNILIYTFYLKDRMEEFKTFHRAATGLNPEQKEEQNLSSKTKDHDTVGSVAIDKFGNLAAATSTGGITGKQSGRVGDTPVIGSGAYADNLFGTVSSTGIIYCMFLF